VPQGAILDTPGHDLQVFTHEGCPIHYRLVGPEGAPLVVLTHGGMVDHRVWGPQVPALVPRYRVLLWDVRGHGRSRPGGRARTIAHMAEDLAALLDHLGFRRATLVGLSAGGWLVQEFAYRHPHRVVALVVVGQSSWTLPPRQARMMVAGWSAAVFLGLSLLVPWTLFVRMLMRHGAAHSRPHTLDYLHQVISQWSKREFILHTWFARGRLRHDPDHRIQQPLMIVHGEHEMEFVRRDAAAWAAREPRCRYEVIPDAGHVATMDDPDAFNTVLLEYLTAVGTEVEPRAWAAGEVVSP
jgi:3-oxoadipate enol-lactonase